MTRKAPYRKPKASQSRIPEFYWRGGDKYKEPEYMTDEYVKALEELQVAEREAQVVNFEVTRSSETLQERDGYTTALAGYLAGDSKAFIDENQLKQELARVEREIAECEIEVEKRQAIHNPAVASGLNKEKAYYMIEIQRTGQAIDNATNESSRCRTEAAQISIMPRYRKVVDTEIQLDKTLRKKKFLRNLVNKTKAAFDDRKPASAGQDSEARAQRLLLQSGLNGKTGIIRGEEKIARHEQKYKNHINFLLDYVEELNTRMVNIGMEDECVDTMALRDRYFGNPEEEEADHDGERVKEEKKEKPEQEDPEEEKNEKKDKKQNDKDGKDGKGQKEKDKGRKVETADAEYEYYDEEEDGEGKKTKRVRKKKTKMVRRRKEKKKRVGVVSGMMNQLGAKDGDGKASSAKKESK